MRRRDERGFTLIELMVVVLIIGVLLAIAIPTFLGARTRGQDAVARESLRIALTSAATLEYVDADSAAMTREDGSLTFLDADQPSTGPKVVSVGVFNDIWTATALSASGICFFVLAGSEQRPLWGKDTEPKRCGAKEQSGSTGAEIGTTGGTPGSGGDSPPDSGGGVGGSTPPIASGDYGATVLQLKDLVGYWPLDETSGSTAKDASGHRLDGTYVGKPQLGDKPAVGSGSSVTFLDSYVKLPTLPMDFSKGFTVSAWAKPRTARFYDRIWDFSNGRGKDMVWLGRNQHRDEVGFEIRDTPKGVAPRTGGKGSMSKGRWTFYVITVDPKGTFTMYLNGRIVSTGGYKVPAAGSRSEDYIGRSPWAAQGTFDGSIDEVSVFGRALVPDEVKKLTIVGQGNRGNRQQKLSEANEPGNQSGAQPAPKRTSTARREAGIPYATAEPSNPQGLLELKR